MFGGHGLPAWMSNARHVYKMTHARAGWKVTFQTFEADETCFTGQHHMHADFQVMLSESFVDLEDERGDVLVSEKAALFWMLKSADDEGASRPLPGFSLSIFEH